MTQTENLRDMKKSEMRDFARRSGLRWYTGLNKEALANFIEASISKKQTANNESWKDYRELNISDMKAVARGNGLRGWSNLRKVEFGKFLNTELNTQPKPQPTSSEKSEDLEYSYDNNAKFMLKHGFTISEVFEELGIETLKLEISKSDIEFEPDIGCEVTKHLNGVLCSNNKLCDFCKGSFLAIYGKA